MVMQTTTTASDGGLSSRQSPRTPRVAGADFLGYRGVIYFTNDRPTLPDPRNGRNT